MTVIEEIPNDLRLPNLGILLEAARMKKVFQEALFECYSDPLGMKPGYNVPEIIDCRIDWVKYKPGKNCTASYLLTVNDHWTHRFMEQRLYARAYPPGESQSRFGRERLKKLIIPVAGRPLVHIPEFDMIAWVFPNDRKLNGLQMLLNQDYLRKDLLPEIISAKLGHEYKIENLTHKVVHYVPEHTCTARLDIYVRNRKTKAGKPYRIFAKTYYDNEGASTYKIMTKLWNLDTDVSVPKEVAEPLGYFSEYRILFQENLPGGPLSEAEWNGPSFLGLVKKAGATVARLHNTNITCSRSIGYHHWLNRLKAVQQTLIRAQPSINKVLKPLVRSLQIQADQLGDPPSAVLHGDLHFKNFFNHQGKVFLIDFDNHRNGPPGCDLGSLFGAILYQGLLRKTDKKLIRRILSNYYDQYRIGVPWELSRFELNWYTAVALVNERAFRSVTRLKTGRLDILDTLIDLAHTICQGTCDAIPSP